VDRIKAISQEKNKILYNSHRFPPSSAQLIILQFRDQGRYQLPIHEVLYNIVLYVSHNNIIVCTCRSRPGISGSEQIPVTGTVCYRHHRATQRTQKGCEYSGSRRRINLFNSCRNAY